MRIKLKCRSCSSFYYRTQSVVDRGSRYCSRSCRLKFERKRPRKSGMLSLGKDIWATVDEQDAVWLREGQNWHLHHRGYPHCPRFAGGASRLNRAIMERMLGRPLLASELVDHEDGNPLNNQRSNLRLATYSQNGINLTSAPRASSGFRGVREIKGSQAARYHAAIEYQSNRLFIGSFSSAEEAAWFRDQWAIELFGDYATLNFDYS